jgi:hypothetical protein
MTPSCPNIAVNLAVVLKGTDRVSSQTVMLHTSRAVLGTVMPFLFHLGS